VYLEVGQQGQIKRTLLLVAYGIRADGSRELIDFMRAPGESQAGWEGFLDNLYHHGLRGEKLQLIVTDGCAGVATALQTLSTHPASALLGTHDADLERVKKREQAKVKTAAQMIYLAKDRQAARRAFLRFKLCWRTAYPGMVKQLEAGLT